MSAIVGYLALVTNFRRREPGQSFEGYLDAMLGNLIAGVRERGYTPAQAQVQVDVTERTTDEIALVSQRAAELGLIRIQLVDKRVPARPGTIPSSLLRPTEAATMAEARAARILGES